MLGIPDFSRQFLGIDRLGERCRIAASVTVMRFDVPARRTALTLGDDVSLYDHVRLVLGDPEQTAATGLHIGHRVIVNVGAYLSGEGGLVIEDEVLIGAYCQIASAGHLIDGGAVEIWRNPLTHNPVRLESGCWLGAHSVILPGVTLGRGAVVGAGAVVTQSVPPCAIVAGNPARLVRYRDLNPDLYR